MVDFVPNIHPGRQDRRGPIVVPRDIFEYVTQYSGWSSDIDSYNPSSRQKYLQSILYWMDENSACVIRNASTGRYAKFKDTTSCATILPGNVLPKETGQAPFDGWTLAYFPDYVVANNEDNLELVISYENSEGDPAAVPALFRIYWGDGSTTEYDGRDAEGNALHTYSESMFGDVSVTQLSDDGSEEIGESRTFRFNAYGDMNITQTPDPQNAKKIIFDIDSDIYKDSDIEIRWNSGNPNEPTVITPASEFPVSETYTTNPGGNQFTATFAPLWNTTEISARSQSLTVNIQDEG